jgi:hypothetical protein
MGFLKKITKALSETANKSTKFGQFKFQEEGRAPITDSKGRVIVKVQKGSNIVLGVNKQDCSVQGARYLLGKPEADKDVESKSVRVRIQRDLNSRYADSISIETPKGDFVGWILKENSATAAKILEALTSEIQAMAPGLENLVFDVGAQVDGTYDEDQDDTGKSILFPDLTHIEIYLKNPAEFEIHSEEV